MRPTLRLRLGTALFLTALGCVGCDLPQARGPADVEVSIGTVEPPVVGTSAVSVRVTNLGWRPLNGARVLLTSVPLDGSMDAVVDTAVGTGAGIYLAEGVRFGVAGEWRLTTRVELTGGAWSEVDRHIVVFPDDR